MSGQSRPAPPTDYGPSPLAGAYRAFWLAEAMQAVRARLDDPAVMEVELTEEQAKAMQASLEGRGA
jgi:hypothetical protein